MPRLPFADRRHRRRQDAGDRRDLAVQRQLADHGVAVQRIGRQGAHRHQHADGDRQVEMAAFLQHVGRRQVHGDPLGREREAEGGERAAHPFLRFADGLVRQPDDPVGDHAAGNLHLDIDVQHVDSVKGNRFNPRDHPGAIAERPRVCNVFVLSIRFACRLTRHAGPLRSGLRTHFPEPEVIRHARRCRSKGTGASTISGWPSGPIRCPDRARSSCGCRRCRSITAIR